MEFSLLIVGTLGYPVMQVFMLTRRSSRTCWFFACLPLLGMVPVIVWSVIKKRHGDYHATVPIFLLSPVALLYLVVVWLISKAFRASSTDND